ncbi:MAG TPA: histidine phosphatase family protein [Candidatus Onthousia excrementipullorum]|uniref:Histidine phosphatase family protein n=1 Tax=Candidatus Onthousia excrementipullorum TaxID=2840884 RepID=A0A9D1J2V5_9FIRM|nr:histidine phosphatase family protein [Candidatus Onthousia excrementipullorum]
MTTIYLMRHSMVLKDINNDYNNESLQLQNEKMPLSIEGEELASNISKESELQNIDVVISSNYVRAMSTAKYISNANNVNLIVNSAFGERKFGINSWDELPIDFGLRQNNDENYKVGDGESQKEVRERVYKALIDVIDKYKDKRIVIVSHGSAILWLLKQWCNVNLIEKYITFKDKVILEDNVFNCTTFKLEFDDKKLVNIEKVF